MRMGSVLHSLLMLIAGITASLILTAESARAAPRAQTDLVEFEKMIWVEVKSALAAGKTTALIYTGGTEQRGPQNANGGHNLIALATAEAIARELARGLGPPSAFTGRSSVAVWHRKSAEGYLAARTVA
ncbi:MAG TPA: hypothetical protein VHW69_06470 [Rhizomicrobium sp.]|nr:hypothetical protein [Rhizomicrobium sp.]